MKLLAIDPGNTQSAYVLYDTALSLPTAWEKVPNEELLNEVLPMWGNGLPVVKLLAIEMIASYGMSVGAEIFQTVYWIGKFAQRWEDITGRAERLVYRADVKLHLCQSRRAKDANVRQALIDKFGPGKDLAIGRKATPGPLYGIAGDVWSALAVAVTAAETDDTTTRRVSA